MRRIIKNHISKRISHSRKKRLCESIFAYCVNRPSTYLCTPVGAVSLSACVSQRLQAVDKPTHRKNADKIMRRIIKNHISKRISHSRKKRLCESIFAYCVNRPSTHLCTPVGAVSLSACVSQRLQRVEKYFFFISLKLHYADININKTALSFRTGRCVSYVIRIYTLITSCQR